MPKEARRAYLEAIRERYKKSGRRQKSVILSEFCQVCGYCRKYAVRILNRKIEPGSKRPGPAAKYDIEVCAHLKSLWEAMNKMCSKKMKAALPLWLPFYPASDATKSLLMQMSPSTIDRALRPYKHKKMKGLSTTKPSLIKNRVPIKLLDSEITKPGMIEGDTVAHCGTAIDGTYVNSLTATDLFSGWTENRALWGKTGAEVLKAIQDIEASLPFKLKGFASDNGTEFLNDNLVKHFYQREEPIAFVRSRAYKKNDSAHVEQKNWTHVRELFGYERLENFHMTLMMNEIYQNLWNPLWNYFTPCMKLKKKFRYGGKIKKIYDDPKTPMQRLLDHTDLPEESRQQLEEKLKTLNPFELKQNLEKKLKIFFEYVDRHKRPHKPNGT